MALIKKVKLGKAAGCDKISNGIIKNFNRKAIVSLANIVNVILRQNDHHQEDRKQLKTKVEKT